MKEIFTLAEVRLLIVHAYSEGHATGERDAYQEEFGNGETEGPAPTDAQVEEILRTA